MRVFMKLFSVLCATALGLAAYGCSSDHKQKDASETKGDGDGIIGTTCTVEPVVRDAQGLNVCIWPEGNWPGLERGTLFYAIPNNITARSQAIEACHQANGLDYGVELGTSCFHLCEKVVACIPFTPNP